MPKYKNQDAKVILLNNFRNKFFIADKNWAFANKSGAFRGGIRQDHSFDNEGNCYLTGYFMEKADFGIKKLHSDSPNRHCFFAKFNKNGQLLWVKNLDGKGISTGISITTNDNLVFVTGTFNGNINCDGKQIASEAAADIFVMKVLHNGDVQWINHAGINDQETGMFLKYAITFNENGKHQKTNLFTENPAKSSEGIFVENNGDLLIAGAFNNTTGLNIRKTSYADVAEMNYVELLKIENDELLSLDVEKSIAGLFAVINLAKSNGITIPGKSTQEALDKYNPRFKNECPIIYENIAKVKFLKNADGIITIKTNNGRDVKFDKVKVKNNSLIKIVSLPSGDEQMDILSGISVGKYFIWYDLNFVRMFQKNGNLLFDYDSDHTQKTMNLKKDILEM